MDPVTFTFGDSRALCDELLALVRAGRKTASCGALRDYGKDGEPKFDTSGAISRSSA